MFLLQGKVEAVKLTARTAQLPPIVGFEFRSRPHCHLGIPYDSQHRRTYQWRSSRPVLELHLDLYRVHVCGDEFGRDGFHVRFRQSYCVVHSNLDCRAPTSGGQYHWVSEFAPPAYQQFFSYVVGWMSTLSWQAGNAADCFLTGTITQALLVVNNPDYEPQRWQGTLFVFAMVFVLYIINIWGHDFWPRIQNGLMVLHVLAFLAVVLTLWVMAPHNTSKAVFTEFHNGGGWPTVGLSLMVGQISAIYSVLGTSAFGNLHETLTDFMYRLRRNRPHGRRSPRCWAVRPALPLLVLHRQRLDGHRLPHHLPLRHR